MKSMHFEKETEQFILTTIMEKFALKLSAGGNLFFAAAGFGFAVLTHSEAILLDGIFSLVVFALSLITLRVAHLVQRPGDDLFHFGYAHFEPLLNVFKSIIILAICVFALVGAIDDLTHGGREFEVGMAMIYAFVATIGCVAIAFYLRSVASKSDSSLVKVDATSWMIDALISSAVFAAFGLAFLFKESAFAEYLPYVDPGLVTFLVIIALPFPMKILKDNLKEVLLFAPDKQLQDEIQQQMEESVRLYDCKETSIRISKTGRQIYINMSLHLRDDFPIVNVSRLDIIREDIDSRMKSYNQNIVMDISFIGDSKWADGIRVSSEVLV